MVRTDLDSRSRDEVVDFCRALVRTPSVNGVHPERDVAQVVADFADAQGLQAETLALTRDRPNVLLGAQQAEATQLVLVAHLDTVSPGDEQQWHTDPFGGATAGGRLFGRGSADNKGGIAAAVAALLMLRRNAVGGSVVVLCVPDEESGATGELGVRHVLASRNLHGASAIYTYPGMHRVVVGHRGVLRYSLEVCGKAIHSGSAAWRKGTSGCNAIDLAVAIVEGARKRLVDSDPEARRVMVTPTVISGGSDASVVPGRCDVTLDVRYADPQDEDRIESEIRSACEDMTAMTRHASYALNRTVHVPPTMISRDERIVQALTASAASVRGRDVPVAISGPANESYILNELGLPTCVLGPRGGNTHGPNEYVIIDSLFEAATIYAKTATRLYAMRDRPGA